MSKAILLLLAALLYVIVPWDLDFVPVVGRVDDLAVLIFALAYYFRMRRKLRFRGRTERRKSPPSGEVPPGAARDPYDLLGVGRNDEDEVILKAYRDLMGKYHPDRVQHLGEEFREMAAEKTTAINRAYGQIKAERNIT